MRIEDGNKIFGEVYAAIPDDNRGLVSVTKFKLQRQKCGTDNWQTKVSKPAQDGFHYYSDIVLGRTALGGRGWWRATAFVTYKRRRKGQVLYKERVSSPRIGDCHPLPSQS